MADNKIRVNVTMPKELHKSATVHATKMGLSFSGLASVAIAEYIKQAGVVDMVKFIEQMQNDPEKVKQDILSMFPAVLDIVAPDGAFLGPPSAPRAQKRGKQGKKSIT